MFTSPFQRSGRWLLACVAALASARGGGPGARFHVVDNTTVPTQFNEDLASSSIATAHSFVTPNWETRLLSASAVLKPIGGAAVAEFSIRANTAQNKPGAILETLGTLPFTSEGSQTRAAAGFTILSPATRYWLVVKNVSGSFKWFVTTNATQSGHGTLLDEDTRSLDGGLTWPAANSPDDYHNLAIFGEVPQYDFGDAPDGSAGTGPGNYQTLLSDNGPRHLIGGCFLGAAPDHDDDGQPSGDARGDDTRGGNDEAPQDGVDFWNTNMVRGDNMGLILNAHCPAGEPARIYVKGWADWNQNGVFESSEVIYNGDSGGVVQDFAPENVVFAVPPTAAIGPTFVRIRTAISPITDPTGLITSGEVEDHRIVVFQTGADLTVNTEADEFDTPSGPDLSLREAIRDSLPFAYNTITFAADARNIVLTRGELSVEARTLEVDADDSRPVTVDGDRNGRVFRLDAACSVTLRDLIVQNGQAIVAQPGGGILNAGTLNMERCWVRNNRSGDGEDGLLSKNGGNGGGLHNSGRLAMTHCRVTGNETGRGGNETEPNRSGRNSGDGGGIYCAGNLSLVDCEVSDNSTGQGGDATQGGSGYGGFGEGGGVSAQGPSFSALRCAFTGNRANRNGRDGNGQPVGNGGRGGGIVTGYFTALTMGDCTIAGNSSAANFYGGGGLAYFGAGGTLRHCTVAGNTTTGSGGGIFVYTRSLTLENCVVAGNTTLDASKDLYSFFAPIVSLGVNFIGVTDGVSGLLPTDLSGDPLLLPLGYYGGIGKTAPPATGSPLINPAISFADASPTDQRGVVRPANGAPDIGAVEWGEHNLGSSEPAGYEGLGDLTRPHDLATPVSYEPVAANPPSPAGMEAVHAIDNTSTNFYRHVDGDGAGLDIELLFAPSRLAGLALVSSPNSVNRDPARFVLLGHASDGSFPLLAEGLVTNFTARGQLQAFHFAQPTAAYRKFRLLFPATRGGSTLPLQIGDVRLFGLADDPTLRFVDSRLTGASPNQVRSTFVTRPGKTYRLLTTVDGVNFSPLDSSMPFNSGRQAWISEGESHALLKVEEK